jgi:hypothetical protein
MSGRPHTDESRAKISAAVAAYWAENRDAALARGEKMRALRSSATVTCIMCGSAFQAYSGNSKSCADCRPRYRKSMKLMRSYGITIDEFEARLAGQGGACAICRIVPENTWSLAVDHDHRTGKVRGLLCDQCNLALGKFQDSIKTLENAIAYLRKHE